MTAWWVYASILAASIIGAGGALYLKKGSSRFSLKRPWRILTNPQLLLGLFLYAASAVFYLNALRGGEVSLVYPLVSVSYIWVLLLSVWLLKEKLTARKMLGVLIIIAGIVLLTAV